MLEFLFQNILIDLLFILFPIGFVLFAERKKLSAKEFGFTPEKPSGQMVLAIKILGALLIYSMLLGLVFQYAGLNDLQPVEENVKALAGTNVLLLVYILVVRVFAEEFFFRAFLVPRIGVVASSVLFGLSHFAYGSIGEVIGAMVLGGILALVYKENKQLMPNYLGHFLYNAVIILLIFS